MKLQGTTALVTGANRGLGRALVEALLQSGARRVHAGARNPDALASLVAMAPDRIVPLPLDLTSSEQVAKAAELAADTALLINNAGALASYGVLTSDDAGIRRDIETNFFGLLHVARAFAPVLEKNRPAGFVSVLSIASLASMPAIGGYSSSKAAAWSLTQALRAELASRGVQVHAVFPGPIDTDMIRDFPVEKTPPAAVARAIVDAIGKGVLDIYPDVVSREVGSLFEKDPAAIARRFAAPAG